MLRRATVLAALAAAAAAPDWSEQAVGSYVGRDHNRGRLQCEQVEFSLRDGALTGHYRIADQPPLEGELTHFVPDQADGGDGHAGWFTWTDRDGSGIRYIRFIRDFSSFYSVWGSVTPDPRETGYGLREPGAVVPGCTGLPTS